MTMVRLSPGKYLNSRVTEIRMSCPGGTFHRFAKAYARTLSLFYDRMPEVKISDNKMTVNFSHTRRTYTCLTREPPGRICKRNRR
jgi:hypothetical protein